MEESYMLICKHCGKECKNENSLRNHERTCPSNENRVYRNGMLGKKGSNQYTKAKDFGIEVYGKQGKEAKERMIKANKQRRHSPESKSNLSRIAKERGLGGHTSKQKLYFRKKNGEEVYLQSSYEIKFAQLLEDMDIEWSRPSPLFWVDIIGDVHRYYPDFKIGDKYFDTKNDYLAIKDADKIERVSKQNNVIVEVVTYENITKEYIQKALLV